MSVAYARTYAGLSWTNVLPRETMVASRDVLLSYMMEYWALVLILGLFHTPSVVHTASATNDKETTEDRLKRMEGTYINDHMINLYTV